MVTSLDWRQSCVATSERSAPSMRNEPTDARQTRIDDDQDAQCRTGTPRRGLAAYRIRGLCSAPLAIGSST